MFNICEKVDIVDAVIENSVALNQHPYTVLKSSIQSFDLSEDEANNLYLECKLIVKSRTRTFSWCLN